MESEVSQSLREFMSAQKRLSELDVIHSRDFLGDIGRYLCQLVYGLKVPREKPPEGYDGRIGRSRVAIEFNNSPVGTPVRVDEPLEFDQLIIILGPHCSLRPDGVASDFIFYRLTVEEVCQRFRKRSGGYTAGEALFDRSYEKALNLLPV
jgi:hypothetical protein